MRSDLPLPYVISDEMPPTEQVNGVYYTSKAAFRRVGRALGLTEVGDQKFKPKQRSTDRREVKEARRQSLRNAVEKYKAGHRPRR
jgi:cytolysin (calcineurin-like family phosphatase)